MFGVELEFRGGLLLRLNLLFRVKINIRLQVSFEFRL